HGLDELVDEGIELLRRRPCLMHAQIERIVQILLVVGDGIKIHGQEILRRYSGAGGVELQLADWDAYAIGPEIPETQNATAVGDANESDVLLWPVPQDFFHAAPARHR